MALLTALPAAADEARPARVASLNLCTDQYVLRLLPRARIVSVSFLAQDPRFSDVAEAAAGLPTNRGLAEEIVPLAPDLVLAGRFAAGPAVRMLRRLGFPVELFDLPQDIDGALDQLLQAGRLLGETAKAEALAAATRARLAALPASPAGLPAPRAVVYLPNGHSAGAATLTGAVLAAAGYRNVATDLGIADIGEIALERLLLARPDRLVLQDGGRPTPSLAEALLRHPALAGMQGLAAPVGVPGRLWSCPGPGLAEAAERLAAARP